MPDFLLALDQGTTSSRAIVFHRDGTLKAVAQKELPQIFPQAGWVEHNPADIWQTQLDTARQVLTEANLSPADVAAIGITNQRETTILWDRKTGMPLHNAIVWQDRRTADRCRQLRQSHGTTIQHKTGLIPDAYFSASKVEWLLDHVAGARELASRGGLAFGTVDSWLLWNLTGGGVHATDVSNASRTMLLNLKTAEWDEDMLKLFNVPREILPRVCNSAEAVGVTQLLGERAIPITGIAGDQQAALFGQNCFSPGLAKNTYGTGCFLLMNVGTTPPVSKNQLLTTIGWRLPLSAAIAQSLNDSIPRSLNDSISPAPITYALEGSVFVGGAVVQWLRDGLGIIQSAGEIEALARSVPDSGGVYLVPAFAGLGAPHWDQYARGTIVGLTRGTTKAHIARAALEAIAFQVADLLDAMHADMPQTPVQQLRVDGGAARNDLLLQFQADILQRPVLRPAITETTALGAALFAGLGAGIYQSPADIAAVWKAQAEFHPRMKADDVAHRRARWSAALHRAAEWEIHGS